MAFRKLVPPVMGHELWKFPEFRALAERLGIDWSAPVERLVISIPSGDYVRVTTISQAQDFGPITQDPGESTDAPPDN